MLPSTNKGLFLVVTYLVLIVELGPSTRFISKITGCAGLAAVIADDRSSRSSFVSVRRPISSVRSFIDARL
jgi:hypothetical protein